VTTTLPSPTSPMAAMDPTRRNSLICGVAIIITFVASIPALFFFYEPALKHSGFILGGGADTQIAFGAFLEVILVIANLASAIVLFPVLKRESEALALSYVVARTMESVLIAIGIISLLTLLSLQQVAGASGADNATLVLFGKSLVHLHDWTFLLGPGFVVGIGNGLILGYLMYRTHLVPRRMALLGLVGGPLVCLSGIAVLFGLWDQVSPISAIATIPEFFWELSLGIYLTVKGFRPTAVARLYPGTSRTPMKGRS
jgi:Domain of unknown function (DUF4386)